MTDKKKVMPRDSNLRYVSPTPFVVSDKKLRHAKANPSSMRRAKKNLLELNAIKSLEELEEGLKLKIEKTFANAVKSPLASHDNLISKGYKLENLAGEKVVKLSSVLNKKSQIKKWGDLSVLYIHNFLTEGFDVVLGQHPKYPQDPDKTAIYLKK